MGQASELLNEMQVRGVSPNSLTYNKLMCGSLWPELDRKLKVSNWAVAKKLYTMRKGSSLVKVPFYISTILLFLNQERRSMPGGRWRNCIREKNIWEMGWKTECREFLLWITSCSRTNKSMFYSNIPILQLDACPEVLQIWYAFWYLGLGLCYSYLIPYYSLNWLKSVSIWKFH